MVKITEQHAIGLLNAAYEKVSACIRAHERYQCEVSFNDLAQARRELETMKELVANADIEGQWKGGAE